MLENITTTYQGADASFEIVCIVLVSMLLGWLARWVYEYLRSDDLYQEIYRSHQAGQREASGPREEGGVMPYLQDDLKIIEGIGPKIEQLLHNGGIETWQTLAQTQAEEIKNLLRSAGERYRIHDPSTWPEQAMLAHEHRWEELKEFQGHLSGGKDLTRIYGKKAEG